MYCVTFQPSPKPQKKNMPAKKDFNAVNRHGKTPLFDAIETGSFTRVKDLLDKGASVHIRTAPQSPWSRMTVNVPYPEGSTPLHAACLAGDPTIVKMLLKRGADPNALNVIGYKPLDYAISCIYHYERKLEDKKYSFMPSGRSAKKIQEKINGYVELIGLILEKKGAPAVYALPDTVTKKSPPAQDAPAP